MTQLEMARQGLPSPALDRAAAEESISPDRLRRLLACGRAVLPANPNHAGLRPLAIGESLRTKVNVNLGTSKDFPDLADELAKVDICLAYGADAVMDLSTGGDLPGIRRAILDKSADARWARCRSIRPPSKPSSGAARSWP